MGCELYDHGLAQCTKLRFKFNNKLNYTHVLCLFVKFLQVKKYIEQRKHPLFLSHFSLAFLPFNFSLSFSSHLIFNISFFYIVIPFYTYSNHISPPLFPPHVGDVSKQTMNIYYEKKSCEYNYANITIRE